MKYNYGDRNGCNSRRGAALAVVILVLVIFSSLLVSITWQIMTNRRQLDRRDQRQQCLWAARSGIEIAAAHLLSNPDYRGETVELIPLAQVRITVNRDPKADMFEITSEARFPRDAGDSPICSLTRRFQRLVDNGRVTLAWRQ